MGNLNLVHMGREVYGHLEGNTKGDFSGVTTTDPRIVIGQVKMTAFTVRIAPIAITPPATCPAASDPPPPSPLPPPCLICCFPL